MSALVFVYFKTFLLLPHYSRFLGVARFQDRAVVASHAYNTVIDLNGVKEVLRSDQLSVRPGVHFSFSSGGSAWHLMSGK